MRLDAITLEHFRNYAHQDMDSDRAERIGWFVAVILAPLFETLIAQALVIRLVRWVAPASFLLPIAVSLIPIF